MSAKPTTCVIGAGISGLTTGKAFSDWGLPYTCFEASDAIGGNWDFGHSNGRPSAHQSPPIATSRLAVSAHRHLARRRLVPRHADGPRRVPGLSAPLADPRVPAPLRRRLF